MTASASASPIQTERLDLEPLARAHAARVYTRLADASLYTFIPKEPLDLPALEARFAARSSPDGTEAWLNWVARERVSGQDVGLFEASVAGETAHVAYFTFSEFQRRGFAREGLEAVIDALERGAGVRTFVAEIDSRNVPSVRLVRSLGFALEATTPNADHFKGASSDEHRFVLER